MHLLIRCVPIEALPAIQMQRNRRLAGWGVIPSDSPLEQPWDRYSRYIAAWQDGADTTRDRPAGMVGVTMPGAGHYAFELHLPFPHPALPTTHRAELAEGQNLFIASGFRKSGLGLVLAYIAPLLARAHGARWLVMENDKTVPAMIPESAWRDTGIVTNHTGDVPAHLMVGRVTDILAVFANAFHATMERSHIVFADELSGLIPRNRPG